MAAWEILMPFLNAKLLLLLLFLNKHGSTPLGVDQYNYPLHHYIVHETLSQHDPPRN